MSFEIFKEDVGKRLKLFIKTKKYSQREFCELLEIGETSLSTVIQGRGGLSFELIYKMLLNFKDLDMNWLLSGSYPTENSGNFVLGENSGMMQINNPPSADVLAERVKALEEQLKLKDQIINLLHKNNKS